MHVPVHGRHLRSRRRGRLHLHDVVVFDEDTRTGDLVSTVSRIVTLLASLLFLNLLHNHAFASVAALSRDSVTEAVQQVLRRVLHAHSLRVHISVSMAVEVPLVLPNVAKRLAQVNITASTSMSHNVALVKQRLRRRMVEEILLMVRMVGHHDRLLREATLVALTEHVRMHVHSRVRHALLLLLLRRVDVLVGRRVRTHKASHLISLRILLCCASVHGCGAMVNHGSRSRVVGPVGTHA